MQKRNKETYIKVVPPLFSEEQESGKELKDWIEKQEETVADHRFSAGLVEQINRPYLTIKNCVFRQQIFIECKLESAQIWDVRFENCDLSNVSFSGSSFHRVEFVSCKLLGTNFSETTLNNVSFTDCNSHYMNLSVSKLSNVRFTSCDFRSASINETRLNAVAFEDCLLIEADLSQTKLRGIDLRTCRLEGIRINVPDLKGAIVQTSQALELLPLLGVVIDD
ncbi:pentapeptide repeat-containing protein [Bacteroides sp. 224]|uniref:pentapeptide repeat-containing protein n=1 Tax=Bacteroides sp. 224 TaxID=2302936 RepID=UPI00194027AE|nr:pentapeptide repeat-containing protein [Bacteroides sp. 224]NDV65011.1 pentapeptide repeat-containing protein [Bacteroides sp. 224]